MSERCALSSLAAGEPLAGTAVDRVRAWFLIEFSGAWGKKGLDDCALDPGARGRLLQALAGRPWARPQLIKAESAGEGVLSLRVVRSANGGRVECVIGPDLATLDLGAWLDGALPSAATISTGPLVLVCAHGKRDACCAEHGLALYRELRVHLREAVWQSTHLGGHRFAATFVSLPDGYQYGRARAEDAALIAAALASNRLPGLHLLRGCTRWSPIEQFAEWLVRSETQSTGLDDVTVIGLEPTQEGGLVRLRTASGPRSVALRSIKGGAPFISSCGNTDAGFASTFELIGSAL